MINSIVNEQYKDTITSIETLLNEIEVLKNVNKIAIEEKLTIINEKIFDLSQDISNTNVIGEIRNLL
jgi:hypothetical protein